MRLLGSRLRSPLQFVSAIRTRVVSDVNDLATVFASTDSTILRGRRCGRRTSRDWRVVAFRWCNSFFGRRRLGHHPYERCSAIGAELVRAVYGLSAIWAEVHCASVLCCYYFSSQSAQRRKPVPPYREDGSLFQWQEDWLYTHEESQLPPRMTRSLPSAVEVHSKTLPSMS